MPNRIEVNVQTGEVSEVELTVEELAAAEASSAAEAAAITAENHPDKKEADAIAALNGGGVGIDLRRLIKAKVISDEAYRLGKAPGALTGAELSAIRNRIAAIYKVL